MVEEDGFLDPALASHGCTTQPLCTTVNDSQTQRPLATCIRFSQLASSASTIARSSRWLAGRTSIARLSIIAFFTNLVLGRIPRF